MKHHSLEHFRTPPLALNCAQSVLFGYQAVTGDKQLALADMKPFGGGRAPGGICGALHAACTLAPAQAETIKSAFASRTGSIYCKDLKKSGEECTTCVIEAADLLQACLKS
jgi:hypothetical protein